MSEAAAAKLRNEALTEFLDDWKAEHGNFTSEELVAAHAAMHANS